MNEDLIIGDKEFQEKVRKELAVENKRITGMTRFGSCEYCPVRDYCTKKKFLNKVEQKKGCEDIRNIYLENVKQWRRPGVLLIRNAADLRTRIQMQTMKDGADKIIMSKDLRAMLELELKYARQLQKYEANSDHHVKYEAIDAEMVIPLEDTKYDVLEDEEVPDFEMHGNIMPDTVDRHNQRLKDLAKEDAEYGLRKEKENAEKEVSKENESPANADKTGDDGTQN